MEKVIGLRQARWKGATEAERIQDQARFYAGRLTAMAERRRDRGIYGASILQKIADAAARRLAAS